MPKTKTTDEGYTSHHSHCAICHEQIIYSEQYDAYYCYGCNVWLEGKCSDPECYFCPNRPEKPL